MHVYACREAAAADDPGEDRGPGGKDIREEEEDAAPEAAAIPAGPSLSRTW